MADESVLRSVHEPPPVRVEYVVRGPSPFLPGRASQYFLKEFRQVGSEKEPRAPGSVVGIVIADAAVDELWLVDAIRRGQISRSDVIGLDDLASLLQIQ